MRSLFTIFFDALFPITPHAKCIRDTEFPSLAAKCAPRRFGDITVLASYRTPLVCACIHEAKFHRNKRAIALLGRLLGEYLDKSASPDAHIIPVPLSRERLRERGYNQALEIAISAREYASRIQVHDRLLKKIRHTPSQTSLSREERLTNLNGVFAVSEHALPSDAHLIVFDDVVTTGATLAEASRTLTEAGFTHVDELALAH